MEQLKLQVGSKQIYQTHEDGTVDEVEAVVAEKNGSTYILFEQVHEGHTLTTRTRIKIKNNRVEVKREGAITNQLVFDLNRPYETDYKTDYGFLDIKIITQAINIKILQEYVNLEIKYEILMQGKKISDNIYFIQSK